MMAVFILYLMSPKASLFFVFSLSLLHEADGLTLGLRRSGTSECRERSTDQSHDDAAMRGTSQATQASRHEAAPHLTLPGRAMASDFSFQACPRRSEWELRSAAADGERCGPSLVEMSAGAVSPSDERSSLYLHKGE